VMRWAVVGAERNQCAQRDDRSVIQQWKCGFKFAAVKRYAAIEHVGAHSKPVQVATFCISVPHSSRARTVLLTHRAIL
jgi:hypothetical protein